VLLVTPIRDAFIKPFERRFTAAINSSSVPPFQLKLRDFSPTWKLYCPFSIVAFFSIGFDKNLSAFAISSTSNLNVSKAASRPGVAVIANSWLEEESFSLKGLSKENKEPGRFS